MAAFRTISSYSAFGIVTGLGSLDPGSPSFQPKARANAAYSTSSAAAAVWREASFGREETERIFGHYWKGGENLTYDLRLTIYGNVG